MAIPSWLKSIFKPKKIKYSETHSDRIEREVKKIRKQTGKHFVRRFVGATNEEE